MTTLSPAAGEIVVLSELECEPLVFVLETDDTTNTITAILLADLDPKNIQRLRQSVGDHERRRQIAATLHATDESVPYSVPYADVSYPQPGGEGNIPVVCPNHATSLSQPPENASSNAC
jgi:hypothetical protein